jgi:hypothetical protein
MVFNEFICVAVISLLSTSAAATLSLPPRNNTIRIGYLTDLVDPTIRIQAIKDAIEHATGNGILSGYEFR